MLILGGLILLHGLVHLLYAGQSLRFFELQAGMTWPDDAWTLSGLASSHATRAIAAVGCVVAAVALLVSGVSFLLVVAWWRPALICAVITSGIVFVAFWDGRIHRLAEQGSVGVAIDAATVLVVLFVAS